MFPLVTFSGGTPPYQNLCCHNNQKRNHTTLAWLTGIRKQTHNGALQNKTSHHRPVCVSCVVSCNANVVQRRCYLGNCRASIAVFWISFSGVHLEEQLGIEAPAQWNIPSRMRIALRQEADSSLFKLILVFIMQKGNQHLFPEQWQLLSGDFLEQVPEPKRAEKETNMWWRHL